MAEKHLFPRTFVISLADETKRRAYITDELKKYDISFEFFDAVDGRKMAVESCPIYDGARRLRRFGSRQNHGARQQLLLAARHKLACLALIVAELEVPAVWTSPDGVSWSRVPHDGAVFGRGQGYQLRQHACFAGAGERAGVLAAGYSAE